MMNKKEFSLEFAGKKLTAQFNDWAENADGSVVLQYGATTLLATVVMSKEAKEHGDFFPLTVDYEEKFYARGTDTWKPGTREGKENPQTKASLLRGSSIGRFVRSLINGSEMKFKSS